MVVALAMAAKEYQDPLPANCFIVLDIFIVQVSMLSMYAFLFHSGVAL